LGAAWVTAVRTAALSAVAARKMADPASTSIAFIGCGVQASSHLAAFRAMFPLKKVFAVGRGRKNVDRFVAEARGLGYEAEARDAESAVREADIVVSSITLNYDVEPFLDARLGCGPARLRRSPICSFLGKMRALVRLEPFMSTILSRNGPAKSQWFRRQ